MLVVPMDHRIGGRRVTCGSISRLREVSGQRATKIYRDVGGQDELVLQAAFWSARGLFASFPAGRSISGNDSHHELGTPQQHLALRKWPGSRQRRGRSCRLHCLRAGSSRLRKQERIFRGVVLGLSGGITFRNIRLGDGG